MTASDIVTALEAGLITQNEAIEQGMVDRLSELYQDPSGSQRWRSQRGQGAQVGATSGR